MTKKKDKTFLLVSLEENKARKVAQVLSNDTARKILDHLSKNDATETDVARELNLPISTVHYNLKQLMDTSLVVADEFHYSEKGKEVLHYSLANKYIVIAPKFHSKLPNKLKTMLPTVLISGLAAAALSVKYKAGQAGIQLTKTFAAQESAAVGDSVERTVIAPETISQAIPPQINPALWFLLGAGFAIIIFLIVDTIYRRLTKAD